MQNNLAEKEELEVVEVDEEQAEVAVEQPEAEEAPAEAEAKGEDELEQYSESVQRRISKLTNRFREEERQRQAAIEYAEAVKQQNEELRARLDKLDQSYVGEFGNRVEADAAAAKEAYRKAYEDGNADGMFEAQQRISQIALEQARYEEAKRRNEERQQQPAPESQAAPQRQQPAAQQPDPKAEAWAGKNEWFGTDQTMTYAAFGIHRQLIEEEGFDPSSDEYYSELDNRIRTEFPHKFAEAKRDSGPRVASAGSTASKSSSSKGRRTVKLTPSQIAIAKRLNVPLEEYAKYVKE
jgi:hypothetical protein|tara:strand:+ start:161 stop:1045 length:885 start_codon:yes stop_codon:yes gene_type:complete